MKKIIDIWRAVLLMTSCIKEYHCLLQTDNNRNEILNKL